MQRPVAEAMRGRTKPKPPMHPWASLEASPSGGAHPRLRVSTALSAFLIRSLTPPFFLRPHTSLFPSSPSFPEASPLFPPNKNKKVPRKTTLIGPAVSGAERCCPHGEPFFPPRGILSRFPRWIHLPCLGSKVKGPREGIPETFKGNMGRRVEWEKQEEGNRGLSCFLQHRRGPASSSGYRKPSFPPRAQVGLAGDGEPNTGSPPKTPGVVFSVHPLQRFPSFPRARTTLLQDGHSFALTQSSRPLETSEVERLSLGAPPGLCSRLCPLTPSPMCPLLPSHFSDSTGGRAGGWWWGG